MPVEEGRRCDGGTESGEPAGAGETGQRTFEGGKKGARHAVGPIGSLARGLNPRASEGRFVNLVNDMPPTVLAPDTTELANRLRPVLLKLNRELRREIHSLGVTGGQVSLLVAIKYAPGIGVRELAARERISVPGMSKFVARLEEAGLVKREPVGGDRRRVGLTLTADGHRVLRSVRSKRTAWLASRLRSLDADELERLDAAIEPLMHLLGDEGA